ncbi:MAG: hypothetical protein JXB07_10970 [Anaerolineae bacterium]|nr:hypothetical protein [Anaerolineae bacterium]
MSESLHRWNTERRSIELDALKNDEASLLLLGLEDPILMKIETYWLYQAGYAAEDIAQAFGYTRTYLYKLMKTGGVEELADKRWGTGPRTRTADREAAVLRVKALEPQRGDGDLAAEFQTDRSTVYELLKEHGLQDLHRVLTANSPPTSTAETEAEKGGERSSLASRHCS